MTHTTPAGPRHTTHLNILRMVALTALLGAVACSGDDSSTGPQAPKNPAGSYVLQQVDQLSMPAEIFNGKYYSPYFDYTFDPFVVTITDGEIILADTGELEFAVNYSNWALETEFRSSVKFSGTYEINGDRIRLDAAGGRSFTGSYKNGVIALSLDVSSMGLMQTYSFRHKP